MLIVRDLTTHWLASRFLVSKIGMVLEQAREYNSVSFFNEIFCSLGRVAQILFYLPCECVQRKEEMEPYYRVKNVTSWRGIVIFFLF